jgi:hypothetical protein
MRIANTSAVLLFAVASFPAAARAQAVAGPQVQRDVFVVGRETAIGDPLIGFQPTRVEYTQEPMDLAGKRELVRMLLMEQGFAHRALPLGAPGLVLHANGKLTVDSKTLQTQLYKNGTCAGAGDRIMVTDIAVLADRINIDVNGGPYLPHRFLRHISINNMQLAGDGQVGELPTGTRITLLFEGQTPRVSAPELKALLEPLLDFGLKSSEQAFADTLPDPIKKAVEEHEVLVGMNRRMVLAALGQPESKLRERPTDSTDGEVFEEWIYGHTPQTIRFVRFRGDRVVLMKTAALGKPIEVNDKDQMADYHDPALIHEVSLGDSPGGAKGSAEAEAAQPKAPSLHAPGERPDGEKSKPPSLSAPDPAAKKSLASNDTPRLM